MKELNKVIFDQIKAQFEPESLFYVVEKPFKEYNDFQYALLEHPANPFEVEDKETYSLIKVNSLYDIKAITGRVKRSILYHYIISNLDFQGTSKTITPTELKTNAHYSGSKYWLNSNFNDANDNESKHLVLTEEDINHLSNISKVYLDSTLFRDPNINEITNLIPDNKVIELVKNNKIVVKYYGFLFGNGLIDESEHYDYFSILITAKLKNPEAVNIYNLKSDE